MTREAQKLVKIRLRHAKFISTLLACLPFVRAVVLNGSLAEGKSKAGSDIDLLIVARSGRIFTARFLSLLCVAATGLKRDSSPLADSRGKICLNYFLTDGFLIIPHHRGEEMNRYCAENYSKSLLLAGDREVFNKFMAMNAQWMGKYLRSQISNLIEPKQLKSYKLRSWLEKLLSGKFGQQLENYLKSIQLHRIQNDPRTKSFPELIHADDREMRFHPPK